MIIPLGRFGIITWVNKSNTQNCLRPLENISSICLRVAEECLCIALVYCSIHRHASGHLKYIFDISPSGRGMSVYCSSLPVTSSTGEYAICRSICAWLSMRHQETVKFGILLTSFKHKQHAGASLCNQLLSHTALGGRKNVITRNHLQHGKK